MNGKVLIIEDVQELADLVAIYLRKEGLEVRATDRAEDALALLESWSADLVILDINLPGIDGFEFLHRFRRTHDSPVIIVSSRDADEDIITGLGFGADEFVTKPFSPRVLTARVRALLRRTYDLGANGEGVGRTIVFGPYCLDMDTCILRRGEERIALSAKEFGVLSHLAANLGRPQSPESIYAAVWGNAYGDLTAVAVYIQRLRRKLETNPREPRLIETVHGLGYRLNAAES